MEESSQGETESFSIVLVMMRADYTRTYYGWRIGSARYLLVRLGIFWVGWGGGWNRRGAGVGVLKRASRHLKEIGYGVLRMRFERPGRAAWAECGYRGEQSGGEFIAAQRGVDWGNRRGKAPQYGIVRTVLVSEPVFGARCGSDDEPRGA
jgi:hypothetical protein